MAGKKVQGVRRVQLPPRSATPKTGRLTALRQRLGQLRTRTINKIKHLLRKHNLRAGVPDQGARHDQAARKWLATLPLGAIDRLEMDLLLAQWKLWDEQIEEAGGGDRQASGGERRRPPCWPRFPAAAAYSSLALASRIGSIERFPRPGSLANYWGLTPGCRNSGEATDRLGSITKQGSAMARFILGQMVLHVLRRDARMKAWYGRIKRRRGSKIARVAVMRRLATIIWHMVKHNEPYAAGRPAAAKRRPAASLRRARRRTAMRFRRHGKGVQGAGKQKGCRRSASRQAARASLTRP